MDNPSKEQILAASSGWVATTLNFLPGLGAGYLYQRRWIPYFVTGGVATAWFILGAILNGDTEPTTAEQLIGMGDMLISTGNEINRLQCAFVDTPEVENICEFIG